MTGLLSRYQANKTANFQNSQTKLFLSLLDKRYEKVLEVGCGQGYFTYVGARNGKFAGCCGTDVFPDFQKEEIEKYAESVTYKDVQENIIPFEDDSFDLVFSMDVVEHVKDTANFIKENLRVCKNGGEIIIGTPNLLRMGNLILWMTGRLKFPRKIGSETYGDAIHFKEYRADDLIKEVVRSSENEIRPENIAAYRCWLGILPLNLGVERFPKLLDIFCQFLFVKFKKP